MKNVPYRSAVGALNWAVVGTRPDIAYAVGAASRFLENPGPEHWSAVKRIFRYLKGNPFHIILPGGNLNVVLKGAHKPRRL